MIAALLLLLGFIAGSLWTLFVVGLSGREEPDSAEEVVVTDTRLIEEARGAPHPADLRQHAIDSLRAVAGDKPIIVIDQDNPS